MNNFFKALLGKNDDDIAPLSEEEIQKKLYGNYLTGSLGEKSGSWKIPPAIDDSYYQPAAPAPAGWEETGKDEESKVKNFSYQSAEKKKKEKKEESKPDLFSASGRAAPSDIKPLPDEWDDAAQPATIKDVTDFFSPKPEAPEKAPHQESPSYARKPAMESFAKEKTRNSESAAVKSVPPKPFKFSAEKKPSPVFTAALKKISGFFSAVFTVENMGRVIEKLAGLPYKVIGTVAVTLVIVLFAYRGLNAWFESVKIRNEKVVQKTVVVEPVTPKTVIPLQSAKKQAVSQQRAAAPQTANAKDDVKLEPVSSRSEPQVTAVIPKKYYTIQLIVYDNPDLADQQVAKLKALKMDAFWVQASTPNGRVLQQVFIGKFADAAEARGFYQKYQQQGYLADYPDSFVRPRME